MNLPQMKLPSPSEEALAHQQKLLAYLEAQMAEQGGTISFADFMHMALYAPALGYYSAGMKKFGRDGDFVTAPEISALFSQCVANQCAQILTHLDNTACILELGAGTGKMAGEIILTLAKMKTMPRFYFILEVSADLKQRQQAYLREHCKQYFGRFIWLDTLPSKPFTGVILGNEVIDAMPVHLFKMGDKGEKLEGFIQKENEAWQLAFEPTKNEALETGINELQKALPESFIPGYTSEINLQLSPWLDSLQRCLEKGVLLFIDYGFPQEEYYHPSRIMGTLMCHYRHHAHTDPLLHIGLQDITAHVDFTAIQQAATKLGLDVLGFTRQANFLIANGLIESVENASHSPSKQLLVSQQVQQLTAPHEMGELFKVIALGKRWDPELTKFF